MTFINAIDNPLLVALYATISVFVVAHMNKMHKGTPKLEVCAWWFLGVGAFAVAIFDIHQNNTEWGHIMFGVGSALLIAIQTQPSWRPLLANRRKNPEQPLPMECDRRCQTFMKTRKLKDSY